jgi:hypothetical protein
MIGFTVNFQPDAARAGQDMRDQSKPYLLSRDEKARLIQAVGILLDPAGRSAKAFALALHTAKGICYRAETSVVHYLPSIPKKGPKGREAKALREAASEGLRNVS